MQLKFTEMNGDTQTAFCDEFLDANVVDQIAFLTEASEAINRLLNAYISNLTDQDASVDLSSL